MGKDFNDLFPELHLESLKSAVKDLLILYQPERISIHKGIRSLGGSQYYIVMEYEKSDSDLMKAFQNDSIFDRRKVLVPGLGEALREWPVKRDWKEAWGFHVRYPDAPLLSDVDEAASFVLYKQQDAGSVCYEPDIPSSEGSESGPAESFEEPPSYPVEVIDLIAKAKPEIELLYEGMIKNTGNISQLFKDNESIDHARPLKEAALEVFDNQKNHFKILKREQIESDKLYAFQSAEHIKRDFIGNLCQILISNHFPYCRTPGVKRLYEVFRKIDSKG